MPDRKERIEEEAIAWHVRLRAAGGDEWERFTLWLEADPEHAAAYDEVALAADAAEGLPAAPRPVLPVREEPPPGRFIRRAVLGWGVAAALLGTVGYLSMAPREDLYAVETGAGERRSLRLADGSRIDFNGSTRVLFDRERLRFARLEAGEALFTVAPSPSDQFRVEAGEAEIRVLGTVFNVVRGPQSVEVAVAEGAVLFAPEAGSVRLTAGMSARKSGGALAVVRQEAASVGGWRESRLTYSSAPVSRIAADLSRNLGVRVEASPAVASRHFSGVIMLDGDRERLFRRVGALLGVEARRTGEGWLLTASSDAAR